MTGFAKGARVWGENHGGPGTELLIELLLLGNGAITNNSLLENGGDLLCCIQCAQYFAAFLLVLHPFSCLCFIYTY